MFNVKALQGPHRAGPPKEENPTALENQLDSCVQT